MPTLLRKGAKIPAVRLQRSGIHRCKSGKQLDEDEHKNELIVHW